MVALDIRLIIGQLDEKMSKNSSYLIVVLCIQCQKLEVGEYVAINAIIFLQKINKNTVEK